MAGRRSMYSCMPLVFAPLEKVKKSSHGALSFLRLVTRDCAEWFTFLVTYGMLKLANFLSINFRSISPCQVNIYDFEFTFQVLYFELVVGASRNGSH